MVPTLASLLAAATLLPNAPLSNNTTTAKLTYYPSGNVSCPVYLPPATNLTIALCTPISLVSGVRRLRGFEARGLLDLCVISTHPSFPPGCPRHNLGLCAELQHRAFMECYEWQLLH